MSQRLHGHLVVEVRECHKHMLIPDVCFVCVKGLEHNVFLPVPAVCLVVPRDDLAVPLVVAEAGHDRQTDLSLWKRECV